MRHVRWLTAALLLLVALVTGVTASPDEPEPDPQEPEPVPMPLSETLRAPQGALVSIDLGFPYAS
jgi:hypothetical protein